ncbi:unnamed protein product [Musa acuminata subsp. burmannicoides]
MIPYAYELLSSDFLTGPVFEVHLSSESRALCQTSTLLSNLVKLSLGSHAPRLVGDLGQVNGLGQEAIRPILFLAPSSRCLLPRQPRPAPHRSLFLLSPPFTAAEEIRRPRTGNGSSIPRETRGRGTRRGGEALRGLRCRPRLPRRTASTTERSSRSKSMSPSSPSPREPCSSLV